MRVGIDYRVAAAHAPGIGRYVRELTRALIELECDDLGLVLTDVGREPDRVAAPALGIDGARAAVDRMRLRVPRSVVIAAGKLGFGIDRLRGGVDVFHHAKPPALPVTRAAQTIAVGDLPGDEAGRAALARVAARCGAVFVFSDSVREPVAHALDVARDRVVAVPVGADHWARELRGVTIARVDPPRILVLGAQATRRDPLTLLAALESLAGDGLRFEVLFAGNRDAADPAFLATASRSPIVNRLRFESPPESALPSLVAESTVLVHLDRTALTPVTPLEALAAGCAVVVSDSPVFREALRDSACYVNADPTALAFAIASAIGSGVDETAIAARGVLAARFTWHECAVRTMETWRALSRR